VTEAPVQPRLFLDRFAGALLCLSAILAVVALMHHPALGHVSTPEAAVAGVKRLAGVDRLVHGALIALMGLMTAGFYVLSRRLGFDRPAPMTAFVAFAGGVMLVTIAAVIDGFVAPSAADLCGAGDAGCAAAAVRVFGFAMKAIQAFTQVGAAAMSVAVVLWGIAFLHRRDPKGPAGVLMGLQSLATGLIPLALLMLTPVRITAHTVALDAAPFALWQLSVGLFLFFARRPPAG
jgi:hypothetical protein